MHHAAYREVVECQFGPWNEAAQDQYFAAGWDPTSCQIVCCDGVACGYLCREDDGAVLHVTDIVLLPAYQGRGVGSALLRGVLEQARQRRVPARLHALHENRALALYRRLGFRETGRSATHALMEWRSEGD